LIAPILLYDLLSGFMKFMDCRQLYARISKIVKFTPFRPKVIGSSLQLMNLHISGPTETL
jgi:hypothetical protein